MTVRDPVFVDPLLRAPFVQLIGSTHAPRLEMTDAARMALERGGAWVMDVHLFSNVSTVLRFEAEVGGWARLAASLRDCPLSWDDASAAILAKTGVASPPELPLRGTLQITFVHAEPDLRHETPAVPG